MTLVGAFVWLTDSVSTSANEITDWQADGLQEQHEHAHAPGQPAAARQREGPTELQARAVGTISNHKIDTPITCDTKLP